MQLRFATTLSAQQYVRQQAWKYAQLDNCPLHPKGGCGFARHGTRSTKFEKRRVQFIPKSMTHSDWVQSLVKSSDYRDVAFSKEMLGKTRFNLVKAGKFEVKDFYYHGKLRTIKELKELLK
jgi:hypothetical protein